MPLSLTHFTIHYAVCKQPVNSHKTTQITGVIVVVQGFLTTLLPSFDQTNKVQK